MTAAWREPGPWRQLAAEQSGVIGRAQLLAAGWSGADVDHARRFAGWRTLAPGVYAVHLGPLTLPARHWAALLRCGSGAALASSTALVTWGVALPSEGLGAGTGTIHVGIEHARRIDGPPGVCLHRRRSHLDNVHPSARPPRHRLDVAVIDALDECADDQAVLTLLLGLLQTRHTTVARLLEEIHRRGRLRRRPLLLQVLADSAAGAASALEVEYLRRVHRRHGLPAALFNAPDLQDGHRIWRDVRYPGLVVELDGARHHGVLAAARDRRRDNAALGQGLPTLRFGWIEVVTTPCLVAATVAGMLGATPGTPTRGALFPGALGDGPPRLRLRGLRACGPGCDIARILP